MPLSILSHTDRQTEQSKANYTICWVSPRGLNSLHVRVRVHWEDRELVWWAFAPPRQKKAKKKQSCHLKDTHTPKKKKKSLTWSPCQSRPSAREFNNSRIRESLRNPLYSSWTILAFSLTYINISLVRPPPLPPSPPFCLFFCIVVPFALVIAGYLGVWSRSPDPCLLLGLNSLRWK